MKKESNHLGLRGLNNFDPLRPRDTDLEGWCQLIGGRVGAAAAVLAFIACYIYGIAKYGILLGIGLGWLPAGFIAWMAARLVAPIATVLLQQIVLGSRHLSSRIEASKLHR